MAAKEQNRSYSLIGTFDVRGSNPTGATLLKGRHTGQLYGTAVVIYATFHNLLLYYLFSAAIRFMTNVHPGKTFQLESRPPNTVGVWMENDQPATKTTSSQTPPSPSPGLQCHIHVSRLRT